VLIATQIVVKVLEVRGSRVKLGFVGPADVSIQREEIELKRREQAGVAAS
jgi:carbon storage regulator CsrA